MARSVFTRRSKLVFKGFGRLSEVCLELRHLRLDGFSLRSFGRLQLGLRFSDCLRVISVDSFDLHLMRAFEFIHLRQPRFLDLSLSRSESRFKRNLRLLLQCVDFGIVRLRLFLGSFLGDL